MSRMVMKPETDSAVPPSTAVIEAIADYEGLEPMDLEQPLYEVIDPDALDALTGNGASAQGQSELAVEFTYNGCCVSVSNDGSVEVSSSRTG